MYKAKTIMLGLLVLLLIGLAGCSGMMVRDNNSAIGQNMTQEESPWWMSGNIDPDWPWPPR